MGRKSKLTEEQWEEIKQRLLGGETAINLAKEYGVDRAAISRRHSENIATVKTVANQILAAEISLRSLPIAQQINAINLADQLRSISGHLAGAANYGAATAHRLSGIAHGKVAMIDDAAPLDDEKSIESLRGISALTRIANDASLIGLNLLKANKESVDDMNRRAEDIDRNMKVTFGR